MSIGSYPPHSCKRRVASEDTDCIRTVGLQRLVGADKAKLKEQARATRMAPTVMEAITVKNPSGTRGLPHLALWWRAELYTARAWAIQCPRR